MYATKIQDLHETLRYFILSSLERWLSGRKHVPAKDAYP